MTSSTKNSIDQLSLEFKQLKDKLRSEGAFDPKPLFSISQGAQALLLFTGTVGLMLVPSVWAIVGASILLGLYYCLAAYISHDVAHGQATRSRTALDRISAGLTLAHGLSLSWWKKKHSLHHAQTNVYKYVDGQPIPVDGDIDTMPLFCWSNKLLTEKHKNTVIFRSWYRVQRFLIWPFFPILRVQWIYHGLRQGTNAERTYIVLHQIAVLALISAISPLGLLGAFAVVLGANAFAGFLLSSFFLFGHSGMHIRESLEKSDEFREQIRSTRNFACNPIITWLSGGLNYQIEHHLFPTLPRSVLPKVAAQVQELARKHGEPYEVDSLFKGYSRIYKSLDLRA